MNKRFVGVDLQPKRYTTMYTYGQFGDLFMCHR